MKIKQDNPHSLSRRLSVVTLALATLTPLAAAMAQAPEVTSAPTDPSAAEPARDAAPTPDPKHDLATAPKPPPLDADKAKAADLDKAAQEAARKKCEDDKPRNPCAPRKKKKCE